jgi:hypothetical protein
MRHAGQNDAYFCDRSFGEKIPKARKKGRYFKTTLSEIVSSQFARKSLKRKTGGIQ